MKDAQEIKLKSHEGIGGMLRAPEAFFTQMLKRKEKSVHLGILIAAGTALALHFAQTLSLGKLYPVGRVVSGVLILGPMLGILFCLIAGLFCFWACNFFDSSSVTQVQVKSKTPPFPFKNLIFKRFISKERLTEIFNFPILKQYRLVWSWLLTLVNYMRMRLGTGKTTFGVLFPMINRAAKPLLYAALLAWLALFWGSDSFEFGKSGLLSILNYVIQSALIIWCVYLWSKALKVVYELKTIQALAYGTTSFVFASVTLIGMVSFVIGIPLF